MLDKIIDTPNKKDQAVRELQQSDLPTIMYGAGSYAVDVTRFLTKQGISVAAYCIDQAYLRPGQQVIDSPVTALEATLSQYEQCNVVIGFADYKKARVALADKGITERVYFIDAPNQQSFFDYAYIMKHQTAFESTYAMLEDDLSREIFVAFVNAKIAGDPTSLYAFADFDQYFTDPVVLSDNESFVDCGAYDGDTIRSFLGHTNGKYNQIFAFEPDEDNYQLLLQNLKDEGIGRVETVRAGCWSEKTTLHFASEGNMAAIVAEGGDFSVSVDTIDNVVHGRDVTYIKMDIEGAELEALKGAEQTIRANRPKLAVCAYHKPDDLIVLPQYIKSLGLGYKFYLRHHQYMSWEMVLYALPEER